MPRGLADAVLAVLARDRPVTDDERDTIRALAIPDGAVAEVQLDAPHGALAAVLGFAINDTRPLLAALGATARTDLASPSDEPTVPGARPPAPRDRVRADVGATGPASSDALARWLDAVAPRASHWGAKLGAPLQLYARGRFDARDAAAIAGASADDLARTLAIAGVEVFSMLGVELSGGTITRHVGYIPVAGPRPAEALARARGVSGPIALLAPDQQWLHLSWDLATTAGPFKVDAGPRQTTEALALARHLRVDAAALAARLAALALGDPSHVGLRIGAPPDRALTLYIRVTAS